MPAPSAASLTHPPRNLTLSSSLGDSSCDIWSLFEVHYAALSPYSGSWFALVRSISWGISKGLVVGRIIQPVPVDNGTRGLRPARSSGSLLPVPSPGSVQSPLSWCRSLLCTSALDAAVTMFTRQLYISAVLRKLAAV